MVVFTNYLVLKIVLCFIFNKFLMVKYSFNQLLLSKLPVVMDISISEIARRCNIRQSVIYNYIKGSIELPLQTLIQICNTLRIPSRFFIAEDEHYIIPNRETATIESNEWEPITWNKEAVELTFGDGDGKIYWKDVADVMGVSSQRPHDRFLLRTRFPISSFLQICSHYKLSPYLFIDDPNQPRRGAKEKRPSTSNTYNSKQPKPNHAKSTDTPTYSELSRRVSSLEKNFAALNEKYDRLLHEHEELVKRVHVNIQNVQYSNIGINDRTDMAAEENPFEKK